MSGSYIAHQISLWKGKERAEDIIRLIDSANAVGVEISADLYPYLASFTGLGILFPDWAKPPNDYQSIVRNNKSELLMYLRERVNLRNGPDATLFGSGKYKGKTLDEVAKETGLPFEEVLMELGPSGGSAAYFIMDSDLQHRLAQSKYVAIGSDGSATMFHPRGYGTHSKIIEEFVNEDKILSLEQALYKMTTFPVEILQLKNRGRILPGYSADLILFDPAQIKSNATYENPHELASGIDYVIVNGKITREKGVWHDGSGKVIRKKS